MAGKYIYQQFFESHISFFLFNVEVYVLPGSDKPVFICFVVTLVFYVVTMVVELGLHLDFVTLLMVAEHIAQFPPEVQIGHTFH